MPISLASTALCGHGWQRIRLTLDAELPDLKPLQHTAPPKAYESDDQIRIVVYGYEVSDKDADDYKYSSGDLLERKLSRKNREEKPIYSPSNKKIYGLDHYISDRSIPIFSGDIYAAKADNGDVDFYLECFENKEKINRYWNCNSNDLMIKPGISYRYYYNSQYLPDARKIHNQVQQMIKFKE